MLEPVFCTDVWHEHFQDARVCRHRQDLLVDTSSTSPQCLFLTDFPLDILLSTVPAPRTFALLTERFQHRASRNLLVEPSYLSHLLGELALALYPILTYLRL